jgi:hypothetical protein
MLNLPAEISPIETRMVWKNKKLVRDFAFPFKNRRFIDNETNKYAWDKVLSDFEILTPYETKSNKIG